MDKKVLNTVHLRSSTIISDATGKPVQHIEYTAFGKSFADWRTEDWTAPYRFKGKERDSETGLYYYGARYYDPFISRFLSIDPLAKEYPNSSPYAYVANNPIRFIDPDGMDWYEKDGNVIWIQGNAKEYISDDGTTYRWLGTTYKEKIDSRTVLNYGNNPTPESMTVTAVDESVYVNQHDPDKIQCKNAGDQIRKNAGFSVIPRNGKESIVSLADDGRAGPGNANLTKNLSALKKRIENGEPVTMGIDYKDGNPGNTDNMTDHFISAVGYTENFNTGQTSIRYFDPGPGGKNAASRGTSNTNIISQSGNNLTGTLIWGNKDNFTVTQIRSRK